MADNYDNYDRVNAVLRLLREARTLLKAAGATKAVKRVRDAISSTEGARRHAELEPIRLRRQAEARQ